MSEMFQVKAEMTEESPAIQCWSIYTYVCWGFITRDYQASVLIECMTV